MNHSEDNKKESSRNTFSLIHDDEFPPIKVDEFEKMEFQADLLEWKDCWQSNPNDAFKFQIRGSSNKTKRKNKGKY